MGPQKPLHPLKRWRLAQGLTLVAAAERVDTTRQSWFEWETGRRKPNDEFMQKVCSETGLTPNDFYRFAKAAPSHEREAA